MNDETVRPPIEVVGSQDVGMDAEDLRIRNEALNRLVIYSDFKGYAEAMFYITTRATESGRFAVAERAGSEVLRAMELHQQAALIRVLGNNPKQGSLQDSLSKMAASSELGKK